MNDLERIKKRVAELLGLHYPPNKSKDLTRGVQAAAKELGIDSTLPAISSWLANPQISNKEICVLSAHLTINETYFFREKPSLNLFRFKILPQLVSNQKNKGRKIKIWCAGCSSGEEPFTLAIMIREYFPELKNWDITILATDISPIAIQKAQKGEYSSWSFRDNEEYLIQKYFTQKGNNWLINADIKQMVTFSYLNLAKSSYPSSLTNTENVDVIFCRNVMMYFSETVIKNCSNRFFNSLQPNGWLVTSQVELNDLYFGQFAKLQYDDSIFYCKEASRAQPVDSNKTSIKRLERDYRFNLEVKKSTFEKDLNNEVKISINNNHLDHLFANSQYVECIELCNKHIAKGDDSEKIKILLAKSYANIGKLDKAEIVIQELLRNKTVTAEVYFLFALVHCERNNHHEAEICLQKALYLDTNYLSAHLLMGYIQTSKGNDKAADKSFLNVLTLVRNIADKEVVPGFGDMTVGRVKEMINQRV